MFRLIGVVVLALPAATSAGQPAAAPPPRPVTHYYPTKVGAKWIYRGPDKGTLEFVITKVERMDDRTMVTRHRVGKDGKSVPDSKYEVSGRGLLQVESAFHTDGRVDPLPMDPPVWCLKLPAIVGERWYAEAQPPWRSRMSFEAGKTERVKVPAGEFEAVPVEVKTWMTTRQGIVVRSSSRTIWYAPGVGAVKWTAVLGGEVVLAEFVPGK